MTDKKQDRIRKAIIILIILLIISLLALGGVLLYRYLTDSEPTVVQVPDNLITDSSYPSSDVSDASSDSSEPHSSGVVSSSSKEETVTAPVIELSSNAYGYNTPFNVSNMFPGDIYTQYFCIRASFEDIITLNFDTDITSGTVLADALHISVKIYGEDAPLYNGPMSDMPVLEYKLSSAEPTVREVLYIIEAYLPTDVGNAYQNKYLIADFNWYVSEVENLKPAPPTGGDSGVAFPWILLAVFSLCGLIILCPQRRKEENNAKQ